MRHLLERNEHLVVDGLLLIHGRVGQKTCESKDNRIRARVTQFEEGPVPISWRCWAGVTLRRMVSPMASSDQPEQTRISMGHEQEKKNSRNPSLAP